MTEAHAETSLSQYIGRSRVLLVFAPSADDPALLSQRRALAVERRGMADRDLAVIEVVGAAEPDVRRRFGVRLPLFAAILIGKDGGEKQRSETPMAPLPLFATIDRMPMRRNEARARP